MDQNEEWEEGDEFESEDDVNEDEDNGEEEDKILHYPRYKECEAIWTPVLLKNFEESVYDPRVLLFDHYLVIKIEEHDEDCEPQAVTLLVIDMRDQSVQDVKINDEAWFSEDPNKGYSLTKYKENQIVKFGKIRDGRTVLSLITIESFQPFQMKSEDIVADGEPNFETHTAQIHNDFLYAFGEIQLEEDSSISGKYEKKEKKSGLWRFDIKNRTWELLNPAGKDPSNLMIGMNDLLSFVFEDNLYVYRGPDYDYGDAPIYILNFETMTWSSTKETMDFGEHCIDQNFHKGHLVFLDECPVDGKSYNYDMARERSEKHIVRYWKISPNPPKRAWPESRETMKIPLDYDLRHATAIYNHSMITFGTQWHGNKRMEFFMFVLDLDFLDMGIEKSEEEKRIESLFMNEEKADITFKVQDKQIPAHKEVLIKKSKYFASALKNLTEPIIDIQDCDENTFKAFLRYLYDEQTHLVNGLSQELVMKLVPFADKYQQYDLRDMCSELLKYNLNSNNVIKAFDLAGQVRLPRLRNACSEFLKKKIKINNISRIIQFLEKQENFEIKAKAISFVLDNLGKISENLALYEDFLVKNFGIDTLALYAKSAYPEKTKKAPPTTSLLAGNPVQGSKTYDGKWIAELSKDGTTDLKVFLVNFGTKHLQEIKDKGTLQDLPKMFLEELVSSVLSSKEKEVFN